MAARELSTGICTFPRNEIDLVAFGAIVNVGYTISQNSGDSLICNAWATWKFSAFQIRLELKTLNSHKKIELESNSELQRNATKL